MERLIFRSLSTAHLEAELRQREFLAEAQRHSVARSARRSPRTGFHRALGRFRLRDRSRREGQEGRRENATNPI